MKKILVILMLSIHLFGNTELSQVFKLPQLITHYFQHNRIDPDINFLEFLAMHYGGDDGTNADDTEDSKLPCHNPNSHSLSGSYTAFLKVSFPSDDINFDETRTFGSRLQTGKPSEHVLLILQPPRVG
jgi:hypothetical protein